MLGNSPVLPWYLGDIPLALEEMGVGCVSALACSVEGIPEQVGMER